MRLTHYLIEAVHQDLTDLPAEEVAKRVKKHSGKYLKLIGSKNPMYRGMEDVQDQVWAGKKKVRQNRKAQATRSEAFKLVNSWLKKKGWPQRNSSVMGTTNAGWADSFGNTTYIFPIGSCDYAWIKSKDFNDFGPAAPPGGIPGGWNITAFEKFSKNDPEKAEQMLEKFVHGKEGFEKAYNDRYETWFNCKEYYFIQYDYMPYKKQQEFQKAFKKIGVNLD